MLKTRLFRHAAFIAGASLLAACGGGSDSSDTSYSEAYIQFYNGSSNSPSTELYLDSDFLGASSYGDATSLFTLDSGNGEFSLLWEDADGTETTVSELELNLRNGYKTLLMMTGDFDDPDISEFRFERSELEDQFYLYALSSLNDGSSFDLYISEEGAPFSEANFVLNLNYLDFQQGQYWNAVDDAFAWDEGDYVLYLTNPGEQDVIFESQAIGFDFSTDYVLVVRNTTGANDSNLVIDVILNSTNITANQDVEATSQFRVYSALSEDRELDITLTADTTESYEQAVSGGELSDFTTVTFGDYQITAQDNSDASAGFNNRLLTLNQGASKTILIFEDENQSLTSIEVTDSTLPQTFEHEVNIANLLPEFAEVDIYFVRDDETIETADYKTTSLDYADARSITLPNDYYSIVVVYEDNLGTDTLLYRSEVLDFTGDDVLMITVEVDADAGTGYRARLLQ